MKRLVLVAIAACALVAPAVASAHPLGNFTINKFARVEVAGHRLYVRYVVDMAEIPTFQAMPSIDTNHDGTASDAERVDAPKTISFQPMRAE